MVYWCTIITFEINTLPQLVTIGEGRSDKTSPLPLKMSCNPLVAQKKALPLYAVSQR